MLVPALPDAPPVRTPSLSPAKLATLARDAALGVPGVAAVQSPRVMTYGLGGQSVAGVRIRKEPQGVSVEIHLVVRPVSLIPLAQGVRRAVVETLSPHTRCIAVNLLVDDLIEESEAAGDPPADRVA